MFASNPPAVTIKENERETRTNKKKAKNSKHLPRGEFFQAEISFNDLIRQIPRVRNRFFFASPANARASSNLTAVHRAREILGQFHS